MEFVVSTQERYQLVDITGQVEAIISKSKIEDGVCLLFVPHSTAAIILTENEPGLKKDFLAVMEKIVSGFNFEHDKIDNNADSHILAGILGQEKILSIENGRLVSGTWQQVFLVELDGPRERKIIVKLVKG